MTGTSIRQALQNVANYPNPLNDDQLNWPVHEHVARALYEIANSPQGGVRGSMARANKARKLIFDRMDGKRRTGTRPPVRQNSAINFIDLTGGEISGPAEDVQPVDGG
jgi:hypothetical protein